MTTLDHATTLRPAAAATRPAFIARLVNAVINNAVAYVRAMKNRRAVYRLGEMSDWELADIGLTRTDLYVARGAPFGTDPTLELGVIATARALAEQSARRAS